MASFYTARDSKIPPLLWPSIAPPITDGDKHDKIRVERELEFGIQAIANAKTIMKQLKDFAGKSSEKMPEKDSKEVISALESIAVLKREIDELGT